MLQSLNAKFSWRCQQNMFAKMLRGRRVNHAASLLSYLYFHVGMYLYFHSGDRKLAWAQPAIFFAVSEGWEWSLHFQEKNNFLNITFLP